MERSVKEKSQQIYGHPLNSKEADDQQSEAVQEEQAQPRRGRRKRVNKNSRKSVNFTLSLNLIERLGYYRVHRTRVEGHSVTNSEVAEEALDKFLRDKNY